MTRRNAILIVAVVLMAIGALADVITISQFGFHLWEPFENRTSVDRSTSLGQLASPVPTVTLTATPTPVPPLDRQLEEALSVSSSSARNVALLIVAQDAVLDRDYWTAIRAASATPSSSAQAKNLDFVVKCAIEDGLYDIAAEAAAKVKFTSDRDRLKIDVIEARRRATSDVMPSDVDRESMVASARFLNESKMGRLGPPENTSRLDEGYENT